MDIETNHRIQAAWMQFHKRQYILLNRHISLSKRLKLFDAAISPCILYGSSCFCTTKKQLLILKRVQMKMLRRIVGWNISMDMSWEDVMRKMKSKIDNALRIFPVTLWDAAVLKRQFSWTNTIIHVHSSRLAKRMSTWNIFRIHNEVIPRRKQGRPKRRWEDELNHFSKMFSFWKLAEYGKLKFRVKDIISRIIC